MQTRNSSVEDTDIEQELKMIERQKDYREQRARVERRVWIEES